MTDRKEFFEAVYHQNRWSSIESRSGYGSEYHATNNLRRELPWLLKHFSIGSILDAPCGDFNWMRHVDLSGIKYIGADIVPDIINQNKLHFGSPTKQFVQLDLATDKLPEVDMIFCRDCLIHCSTRLVNDILLNIVQSQARFFCVTHDISYARYAEQNLQVGDLGSDVSDRFRCINFTLPPFNFPPPIHVINEPGFWEECKTMAMWSIAELRSVVAK
ncbi:class I SAM-dependent methyltransferase [Burkholderia ubonensis]|uniref:class I SAM-dependent methyltransferase n=1 Tax=Burkholderia ubonensis TaxID=101571 RepID=UPI0009B38350|nr:class I SAM-dependent methyltransferase [Burkholderia ubonensis]